MKINSGILIKVKEDMDERINEVGCKLEKQRKDNATLKQEILDELNNSMKNSVTRQEMDKACIMQIDKINAKDKPEFFADIVKEQLEMKMEQHDQTLQHVKSCLEETRTKVRDKEN